MTDDPLKALAAALDVEPSADFSRRVRHAIADDSNRPSDAAGLWRATAGLLLAAASVVMAVSLLSRGSAPVPAEPPSSLRAEPLMPWATLRAGRAPIVPAIPVRAGRASIAAGPEVQSRPFDVQVSVAETVALRQLFSAGARVPAPPVVDAVIIPELSIAALDPEPAPEGVQK